MQEAAMPKLEELRKFVFEEDRGGTPIFAGRTREIGAILDDLRRRTEQWREGNSTAWKSATRVIQGAPGAGKTAILEHLAETLPRQVEGLQVCWLASKKLEVLDYWTDELARALAPGKWAELQKSAERRYGLSVKAEGAGAIKGEVSNRRFPASQSWNVLARWGRTDKGRRDTRLVLLLIDEIQNVRGDEEGEAAAFLNPIHEAAYQLPVFPVYGGLAWSESRLGKLGLTRFGQRIAGPQNVHTLDAMPENESREVCEKFFKYFEITGGERLRERWTSDIVAENLGWPHHLHTHLQALGHALLRDGVNGDLNALEQAGDDANARVGEMAAKARERYYQKRLDHEDLNGRSRLTASAALRIQPGKNTVARLGREIKRIAEQGGKDDPDMELPEGMSGEKFANAMIRAGLLHKGPKDVLSVPIPSFVDYLKKEYGSGPDENPEAKTASARGART